MPDVARIPTCVWRISDAVVLALDEQFGDPVDAYVNGSQTWLLENGPAGMMLEWRLHPVGGYQRPANVDTYDVFPATARALFAGEPPPVPTDRLWEGLEAFPAYEGEDETEPALLKAAVGEALGIEPDACGLVDHQAIGDEWERSRGQTTILGRLLEQLAAPENADNHK
ncbi:MAG: hypothetical protein QOF60_2397 [Actinomycetota bacterium]|jgi:hypothetical protein|nr:hypothetical protein [Actinomycetota bacterium]